MEQNLNKFLADAILILIRSVGFVYIIFLTLGIYASGPDASPYAIHAWLIGVPSVLLIERVYTKYWNGKRGGTTSATGTKR